MKRKYLPYILVPAILVILAAVAMLMFSPKKKNFDTDSKRNLHHPY